jgi:hypothetical protein
MQHEDFSIALLGKQSLLCFPNKDKVTSLYQVMDSPAVSVQRIPADKSRVTFTLTTLYINLSK